MSNDYNIVLYGSGMFGRNNSVRNQQQLEAIQQSGFTTVILWTIHVWNSGDLFYNNSLIVSNGEFTNQYRYLPDLVNELKTTGTVKKVLFCIGSGGAGDFAALKQLLTTKEGTRILQKNFGALATAMPIDGFDFDLEEFPLCNYTETVVKMTLLLNQLFGLEITYCPYTDEYCSPPIQEPFWENCLAQVYQQNNSQQIVSWFNLQCYSGGFGNDPSQWVKKIKNYPTPLGIKDASAFIVPGFACANPRSGCQAQAYRHVFCPSDLQTTFQDLATSDPGIRGGFVWNSSDIFACASSGQCGETGMNPSAYAQAILNGLQKKV